VVGATVCDRHAGKAPQVVDAATVRLTVAEQSPAETMLGP
jgi:hypothetical protein